MTGEEREILRILMERGTINIPLHIAQSLEQKGFCTILHITTTAAEVEITTAGAKEPNDD